MIALALQTWVPKPCHANWSQVLLMSILDLPFAISPVVTGLMLVLLYGRNGWFAPVLDAVGFNVVFAFPGLQVQHDIAHSDITVHLPGFALHLITVPIASHVVGITVPGMCGAIILSKLPSRDVMMDMTILWTCRLLSGSSVEVDPGNFSHRQNLTCATHPSHGTCGAHSLQHREKANPESMQV